MKYRLLRTFGRGRRALQNATKIVRISRARHQYFWVRFSYVIVSQRSATERFFHHIATKLRYSDFSALTVGSDDDAALRRALSLEFPGASQVVCSRYLKQNVERRLRDEVNVERDSPKRRRDIVSSLFGTAGLSSIDDLTQFDRNVSLTIILIVTFRFVLRTETYCWDHYMHANYIGLLTIPEYWW